MSPSPLVMPWAALTVESAWWGRGRDGKIHDAPRLSHHVHPCFDPATDIGPEPRTVLWLLKCREQYRYRRGEWQDDLMKGFSRV